VLDELPQLPKLAYSERAKRLIEQGLAPEEQSIADFCRHSHLWARRGAVLLQTTFVFNFACIWLSAWRSWPWHLALAITVAIDGCVAIVLLWMELFCMQDIVLPWQKLLGGRYNIPFYGRIESFIIWALLAFSASTASHFALWLSGMSAGQYLYTCSCASDGYRTWGCRLVGLWFVSTFLQPLHALFRHTPDGTRNKHHNREGEIETYDAWTPPFGRKPEEPRFEIRFCTLMNWVMLVKWESTHYEASLDWSRVADFFSVLSTFPSYCMEQNNKRAQQVRDSDHGYDDPVINDLVNRFLNMSIMIVKMIYCYIYLVSFPRCLRVFTQATYVLGTHMQTQSTVWGIWLTIIVIVVADGPLLYAGLMVQPTLEKAFPQIWALTRVRNGRKARAVRRLSLNFLPQCLVLVGTVVYGSYKVVYG